MPPNPRSGLLHRELISKSKAPFGGWGLDLPQSHHAPIYPSTTFMGNANAVVYHRMCLFFEPM